MTTGDDVRPNPNSAGLFDAAEGTSDLVPSGPTVFIDFDGGQVPVVLVDGEPQPILRLASDALNLSWAAQYRKVQEDPAICVAETATQLPGDDQSRTVVTTDLDGFSLWLAKINASRVSPGARGLVITWQRKAARAIRERFFGRRVAQLPDRRALALMVIEAEDRADAEKARADVAEGTIRQMRAAGGLNLRTFRKKYFPDVGEKVFLAHCYRKDYLIDQRPCWPDGERKRDSGGDLIYGPQHNHPGHAGLGWLKLEETDVYGGKRRAETRVRTHTELDFVARLVQDGLPRYDQQQVGGAA